MKDILFLSPKTDIDIASRIAKESGKLVVLADINKFEEYMDKAFKTFVQGEDNSWKSEHNLNILKSSIKDSIRIDGNLEKP